MRRGTTELAPSLLTGEGQSEGKKVPFSHLYPIPAACCPCQREARFFTSFRMTMGRVRMTMGEGMTIGAK